MNQNQWSSNQQNLQGGNQWGSSNQGTTNQSGQPNSWQNPSSGNNWGNSAQQNTQNQWGNYNPTTNNLGGYTQPNVQANLNPSSQSGNTGQSGSTSTGTYNYSINPTNLSTPSSGQTYGYSASSTTQQPIGTTNSSTSSYTQPFKT